LNYTIVINGIKSLLYNIGAKSIGDIAEQLETEASKKNQIFCNENNGRFCDRLRWLSQRVSLALPREDDDHEGSIHESPLELVELEDIIRVLARDFSIGDCDAIDEKVAILRENSSCDEYDEYDKYGKLICDIIKAAEIMEYEDGARLCKEVIKGEFCGK